MTSNSATPSAAVQPWHFFVIATMLAATATVLVARDTTFENLLLLSLAVMAAGLVGLAVHWTLWPLASSVVDQRTSAVGGRTRLALEREKMLVLRSIKELEFDRAMGKIADTDFQEMTGRLRARAVGLMKQLDERPGEWRDEIERELRQRLAAGQRTSAGAAESRGMAAPELGVTCADCGTANDADARFCKNCGLKLSAVGFQPDPSPSSRHGLDDN